jgi:hypothetical protein
MSILLLSPLLSPAQDSTNYSRLELDVRQLQREVLILSQLVNQLRTRADAPASPTPHALMPAPVTGGITPPQQDRANPRWVDAGRWRGLRTGMSELEVIETLGRPTSTRTGDGGVVLLYAIELGSASFLAGSVSIQDHAVVAIETPVLK